MQNHNSSNRLEDFQQAIFEAGLGSINVIDDDKIHRFHVQGHKKRKLNGWYILSQSSDGYHGSFGDWSTDFKQNFSGKHSKPLSQRERNELRLKIKLNKQQRAIETRQKHEAVAVSASQIWSASTEVTQHPYLKNKQIQSHGIRQHGEKLIIPMRDVNNKIWSIQTIGSTGIKRFRFGGDTTGNFYQVGELTDPFYIAEGFSTSASVHQYFKKCCFSAFTCGNLLAVGKALKAKYPNHEIIFMADNDTKKAVNAGLTSAREAAKAIRAKLIYPVFPEAEIETVIGTDFNDYLLEKHNEISN